MTPEEFDQFIADFFSIGYKDALTLVRFVKAAKELRADNELLTAEVATLATELAEAIDELAELAEMRRGLDALGKARLG